jgi:membrane-associated protease RseP (regulator of RpoE activity)
LSTLFDSYIPLLEYLVVWFAIIGIAVLLKSDKHGVIAKPYYLMLKTVAFNRILEKIGGRFQRAWKIYFDIGAVLGVAFIAFILYAIAKNAISLFQRSSQAGPTLLIVPLPGVTIGWDIFPYILFAIAVLLIPHEAAHGIASVLDKVPIKSSGVFMAIFLPGGFVEIDEEDLAKRKALTKMRVFAAGSFTNAITFALVLLLLFSLFQTAPAGVVVTGFTPGSPAAAANLPEWSVITGLNGTSVNQIQDIATFMHKVSPGSLVQIRVNNGQVFNVTTGRSASNSSRAILGIYNRDYVPLRYDFLSVQSQFQLYYGVFFWLVLILPNVALINMLPMVPFDGDRYFDTLLGVIGVKHTRPIRTIASVVSLGLLASNLILSLVLFGTVFPR